MFHTRKRIKGGSETERQLRERHVRGEEGQGERERETERQEERGVRACKERRRTYSMSSGEEEGAMAGVLASEVVVKAIPCPRPSSGEEASTSSSTAKECVAEQEKSSSCFESVGAKASQQLFDRKSGYDSFEAQCGNTPDGATIMRLVLKPFEHQVAGHRFEGTHSAAACYSKTQRASQCINMCTSGCVSP